MRNHEPCAKALGNNFIFIRACALCHALCPLSEVIIYCSATAGAWPLSAERKIEVSAEQRLQMYVVNGSDGRCLVAVRLIVGVRYLERPLREVLL